MILCNLDIYMETTVVCFIHLCITNLHVEVENNPEHFMNRSRWRHRTALACPARSVCFVSARNSGTHHSAHAPCDALPGDDGTFARTRENARELLHLMCVSLGVWLIFFAAK